MNIKTERLILDYFRVEDAPQVARLAGDIRVSKMTASLPHPYEVHMAEEWISSHQRQRNENSNFTFAIRKKDNQELIGAISIGFNEAHSRGYIGYWSGVDFWGQGFGTEALKAIINYGFSKHGVNKIWAEYKSYNKSSGRVMEKAGMLFEGFMRKHFKDNDGSYVDIAVRSILREEFQEVCTGTQE